MIILRTYACVHSLYIHMQKNTQSVCLGFKNLCIFKNMCERIHKEIFTALYLLRDLNRREHIICAKIHKARTFEAPYLLRDLNRREHDCLCVCVCT